MEIIEKLKKQSTDEKIAEIERRRDNTLYYVDKVYSTFNDLKKSLLDCLSVTARTLIVSSGFNSSDSTRILNLLNFLNQQYLSCDKFVSDYLTLKDKE